MVSNPNSSPLAPNLGGSGLPEHSYDCPVVAFAPGRSYVIKSKSFGLSPILSVNILISCVVAIALDSVATMDLILIVLAVGLGFTAYSIVEKRVMNNAAVGRRVLLTYAGRNDEIKNELRWTGTIHRKLRIGSKSDNFVIILNEPIIHKHSVFSEVVVRERMLGKYIGSSKPTEVHLFLPKRKMIKGKYKWDSFEHAAWLTIQLQ